MSTVLETAWRTFVSQPSWRSPPSQSKSLIWGQTPFGNHPGAEVPTSGFSTSLHIASMESCRSRHHERYLRANMSLLVMALLWATMSVLLKLGSSKALSKRARHESRQEGFSVSCRNRLRLNPPTQSTDFGDPKRLPHGRSMWGGMLSEPGDLNA